MNRILGTLFLSALFVGPVVALAQTTPTSSQVQAMLAQIQTLQAQIEALKAAQTQVTTAQTNISNTLGLMRNLKQGMTGDDVKTLQTLLASDPTIYQGGVTGFFGNMTAEGVKKFQKKHGFEAVGFVGPKTLKKLNEEIGRLGLSKEDGDDDDRRWAMMYSTSTPTTTPVQGNKLCVRIPPGHMIAPGWLKKERGDDDNDNKFRIALPECQRLPKGIEDKLKGWWPGTTTPATTTPPTPPADTTAPVISSVTATSTTASTTLITWMTNEMSTSKVWFGTTTPVDLTLTPVTNGTFVTSHSIPLSGLATSTVYYYVVGSDDALGNKATSTQNSFTTLAQ